MTTHMKAVDVLVAGGSIAGAAVAAACAPLGLTVLVVEPKPVHGRRLAGELIHPPGVEGLRELGLLDDTISMGNEILGFSIFPFREATHPLHLPYYEMKGCHTSGIAVDHESLKESLLAKIKTISNVSVLEGWRVVHIETLSGKRCSVSVRSDDDEIIISARLVIGADGPMSQVRKLADIPYETYRYSGMVGLEIEGSDLPSKGYGNIFLNPAGMAYAYELGEGRARIMFEVLKGYEPMDAIQSHLLSFPSAFRHAIEAALLKTKLMAASNFRIVPESSVKGIIALVGDARGCCHPVTASGITTAVKDALFLRDALRETTLNIPAALQRYSVMCGRLQLTRRTLSEELREAFLAHTPEAALLNECIFTYWKKSRSGRAHSLALLSTVDSRISSMGIQFFIVVMQSFHLFPHWWRQKKSKYWFTGLVKLFNKSVVFQKTAVQQWLREQQAY